MAFDEAKWRAAAKAEGHSDEDIEAFIASRKASAPIQPASSPAEPKPFGAATEEFRAQGQAEQAAAKQARDTQVGPFTIPDWMTPALGAAAAGALGYGGKALVDKLRTPAQTPYIPVEPTFDVAQIPEQPAAPAPDPLKEAKIREAQAKAELRELQLEKAKQGKAPVAPPASTPVQTPADFAQIQQKASEAVAARLNAAPPTAPVVSAAPVIAPPATVVPAAPAVAPVTAPAAPVVAAPPVVPEVPAVTQAAPPSAAEPAAPVAKKPREKLTFKTTPEGMTFRPDLGPGDKWLINTAYPERRRMILNEFNEGKPAGSYEEGVKLYKQYLEKYPKESFGPVLPVEEAKARGIKPPESFGGWGKAVKVGGTAGLLLTAAELAQAAQKAKQDKGASLKELAFNAIGMIPGLGTAFNAMTFSGGLNTNEEQELARRRGIAPPAFKR